MYIHTYIHNTCIQYSLKDYRLRLNKGLTSLWLSPMEVVFQIYSVATVRWLYSFIFGTSFSTTYIQTPWLCRVPWFWMLPVVPGVRHARSGGQEPTLKDTYQVWWEHVKNSFLWEMPSFIFYWYYTYILFFSVFQL